MVYSFYDPEAAGAQPRHLHDPRAHRLRAPASALPYLYLGYWIEGSRKMNYKNALPAAGAAHPQRLGADGRPAERQ